MNKTTSYIVAVLACAAYLILFNVVLVLLGGKFDDLGFFWKTFLLGVPILGLWRWITSLAKKENEIADQFEEDDFKKNSNEIK
jgi:uncharacterized membrane-anchored protein YitT (DUF2179 family)